MQTKQAPKAINATVLKLPYMKHFGDNKLTKVNPLEIFKPGEKPVYNIIRLVVIASLCYGFLTYVVPFLFVALAKLLAVVAAVAILGLIVFTQKLWMGWLRIMARKAHKYIISQDPFLELRNQQEKLIQEQGSFDQARGKIKQSYHDMNKWAGDAEKSGRTLKSRVESMKKRFDEVKNRRSELKNKRGKTATEQDEYVEMHAEFMKLRANIERTINSLEQQKDLVRRYGMGAKKMRELDSKLTIAKTHMDIKLLDLKETIVILEREYEYAANAKQATAAAESVLGFQDKWEIEYAMNVVTSTIAGDIQTSNSSMNNINRMLDGKFDMNDDDFIAELDVLIGDLNDDSIPSADNYSNPDYKETSEDKRASGFGGQDIF